MRLLLFGRVHRADPSEQTAEADGVLMRASQCRDRRLCPRKDLNFPLAHRAKVRSMRCKVGQRAEGQNRP